MGRFHGSTIQHLFLKLGGKPAHVLNIVQFQSCIGKLQPLALQTIIKKASILEDQNPPKEFFIKISYFFLKS